MSFLSGLLTVKTLAASAVAAVGLYAVKRHFTGGICRYNKSNFSLKGKNVIITGANTGIGLDSAVELASMGATVVMACRDEKRATAAVADVRRRSGSSTVEYMHLDLSDLDSVRKFVASYRQKYDRLHVLLNNAGVMMCPHWKTAQGYEMQFGTNHLGHFLLTNLLLDTLKASAPSRIVNVSSEAHKRGPGVYPDDLDWKKREYSPMHAYGQSKLANILFTEELARRLTGTGVTAYALHPGVVRTELSRHLDWKVKLIAVSLSPLLWLLMKDSWAGAQTNIWCSIAPELEKESGKYYADCQQKKTSHVQAGNAELAARLWAVSEKLIQPGAEAN